MTISHRLGSYPVRFTLLSEALEGAPADSFVLSDENVARSWGHRWEGRWPSLVFPAGEATKSISAYERGLRWLVGQGASRKSTILAIGGGVIGDLAGFVAASYMRGIAVIQVPTSLLAMVDSSVGGKVGIDLPEGKNLAGAFYPPASVEVCVETLATLPEREFASGMAEVIKYGFILSASLLQDLRDKPGASAPELPRIIRRCIELKAQVVEQDEFETTGLRAVLNFGHTVGHALEKVTGYGAILHGEAVAVGMVAEAVLGEQLGITALGTSDSVREQVQRYGLPTTHTALGQSQAMMAAMRSDKKASSGNLAFSLVTEPGACKLVENVPPGEVEAALRAC